jgi:hypothetical protein
MIDRIDAALRHWELIRPSSANASDLGKVGTLSDWIMRIASPVIAELIERPDFRQHATWSLDNLTLGCRTPARELVDAIERRLIAAAKQLAGIAEVMLQDSWPDAERIRIESIRDRMKTIASRPWRDLCSALDYFGPAAQLNLPAQHLTRTKEGTLPQMADFLAFAEPKWKSLGDYVFRCLHVRVNVWTECLAKAVHLLRTTIDRASPAGVRAETPVRPDATLPSEAYVLIEEVVLGTVAASADGAVRTEAVVPTKPAPLIPFPSREFVEIRADLEKLRGICELDVKAPFRQAAITLVQVFAAFHANATLSWLRSAERNKSRALEYRWRLETRSETFIAEACAAALAEMRPLYRETDVKAVIARMSKERRLCLVEGIGRREVYWDDAPLGIEWERHDRAWILLRLVAERAKSGRGVSDDDRLGISIRDASHDLRTMIPGLKKLLRAFGKNERKWPENAGNGHSFRPLLRQKAGSRSCIFRPRRFM